MHDGVAQDVASLGYLVDNIAAAAPPTRPRSTHVARLRKEVSRVVGELRNSVFDLRNEVGAGQGLGQSIASFARHIGSHSDLTVHVTLDESTVRLRPRVEAELLRIAQEAINNARRHSGGARTSGCTAGCTRRRPRSRSSTTARASAPAATTRTGCGSCGSAPSGSAPTARRVESPRARRPGHHSVCGACLD